MQCFQWGPLVVWGWLEQFFLRHGPAGVCLTNPVVRGPISGLNLTPETQLWWLMPVGIRCFRMFEPTFGGWCMEEMMFMWGMTCSFTHLGEWLTLTLEM